MGKNLNSEDRMDLILKGAKRTYRDLVEAVQCGVYIADIEGNILFVNHMFAEMLGYGGREEMAGLNFARDIYLRKKDREVYIRRLQEQGFVRDYEVELKKKDAEVIVISVTSNFIKNDSGDIIGIEGVVIDITEKKRLEIELKREKIKLEQILNFEEEVSKIRKSERLFDFVVEKSLDILEAERCSLMLLDEENGELCIKGSRGIKLEAFNKDRLKIGERLAGVAAKEGKPVLVRNIEKDERFKVVNNPDYRGKSFIIVPIELEGKIIGVINITDKKESSGSDEFTPIDLKILTILVRGIAVAI
ncbi:MAG: PAS domain S-box protein, partial [Candidatus Omnitrophica bacterium]|nr:PAS domain S-box protein [Candidatus Omnitrophota bacterium]